MSKDQDPTLEEMRDHLQMVMTDSQLDWEEIDAEEAIYWFASAYHSGQSSNLYAALSASKYTPSPMHSGPSGMDAIEMYHELIDKFAPPPAQIDEVTIDSDDDKLERVLVAARRMLTVLYQVRGCLDDNAGENVGEALKAAILEAEQAGIYPKEK